MEDVEIVEFVLKRVFTSVEIVALEISRSMIGIK